MKRLLLCVILFTCADMLLAAQAQGRSGTACSAEQAKQARDKGAILSWGSILRNLKKRYGGYQIDAKLFDREGGPVYVIDWMTGKGERVRIRVNARTGRILS